LTAKFLQYKLHCKIKFISPVGYLSGVNHAIKGKTYPIIDGDQDPDNLQHFDFF
jgi:hypothetical protein